ncbi:hypothetical protein [Clostridium sp. UBA4548]|uniref:hypothetical protein n=1 Tax=Clostridium sp. UBA4548 TaxID=1946361 RepID=UPI0025C4213F|nr:hypothetical protein [Clostridium sp. UBA4548]
MFKSFYDPEVEKRGMKIGAEKNAERIAKNLLLKGFDIEIVAETTELSLEKVKELAKEIVN